MLKRIWNEISNNSSVDGRIIDIVCGEEFDDPEPDIIVGVKEWVLLEIINNRKYVKAHPIGSLKKYHQEFEFIKGSYWDIFTRVIGFGG